MDHEYVFKDFRIKVPRRLEDYIDILGKQFPEEREAITAFFREIKICFNEIYERMLLNRPMSSLHIAKWANIPFTKMMDTYFKDHRLKQLLSILSSYITDEQSILSVEVAIPLFGYYLYGGCYPKGGSHMLTNTLADVIETHSGNLRLRTPVRKIIVDNGNAEGIELANGETIHAGTVISNADVRRTFLELVGSGNMPLHFSKQIEKLQPSASAFLVSLGIDFVPETEPVTMVIEKNEQIEILSPSKVDPSLAPEGYAAVTVFKLLPHEQAVTWNCDDSGYSERKKRFGDELIAMAEKAIPKLKDHIIYRQDASPATFSRYAWTTDGAIYSMAIDQWRPPAKSPVKGLYMVGAGTSKRPGVEDAVYSGIRAAESVVKEDRKIHKDI
jgi:phytoene dehydrogenase-like protein